MMTADGGSMVKLLIKLPVPDLELTADDPPARVVALPNIHVFVLFIFTSLFLSVCVTRARLFFS